VVDQGFNVTVTFVVFKVGDDFSTEEIYRGGTITKPLTFFPKSAVVYNQKILHGIELNDYYLFDPLNKKLSHVYMKNGISSTYWGGFFNYNNKLYVNGDMGFYSQKIHEISIVKGK
jgi:hypothetical protein